MNVSVASATTRVETADALLPGLELCLIRASPKVLFLVCRRGRDKKNGRREGSYFVASFIPTRVQGLALSCWRSESNAAPGMRVLNTPLRDADVVACCYARGLLGFYPIQDASMWLYQELVKA